VELFGIVFAIPVAFIMSMVCCAASAHAIGRFEGLRRWLFAISVVLDDLAAQALRDHAAGKTTPL
jgi:hypothetical protein